MTMAAVPAPLRPELADAGLRRTLTAALRLRVPAREAEDLAQTVLCEALASPRLPTDPVELRRWVVAIARHKIADFHRRGRRLLPTEDGVLDPVDPRAPEGEAHHLTEARELLEDVVRVASGAEERGRGARTLEWLVREHEGEQLREIAEAEGLPATLVRQRVSRLRRALRARYAGMLALLVASGAALAGLRAVGVGPLAVRREAAIVADATSDGARVLAVLQGRWEIEELALDPASEARLEPAERTLLAAARGAEVVVEGKQVRLVPGSASAVRALEVVHVGEGTAKLVGRAQNGAAGTASLAWGSAPGALEVALDDGRIRGRLRLRRH